MIRVVLDTNVIVSAYLNQDGFPFFITKLALSGIIQLWSSEPILAEYEELLQRKSYPLDRRRGKLLLAKLRAASTIVKPAGHLSETSDPDDNIFLECAQAAKADYLITGNSGHFPASWKYTEIVTPRGFIKAWKDLYGGTGPRD
jgi:putative PIN family toxin of toxin-antitoxin system